MGSDFQHFSFSGTTKKGTVNNQKILFVQFYFHSFESCHVYNLGQKYSLQNPLFFIRDVFLKFI